MSGWDGLLIIILQLPLRAALCVTLYPTWHRNMEKKGRNISGKIYNAVKMSLFTLPLPEPQSQLGWCSCNAMPLLGQESLPKQNDTKFLNWNHRKVSVLVWSQVQAKGLRKQMSFSQQLKRGKQLHNGSNLSEITRSQSTIIITLVSTKPSGRNPRYKHKWSTAQRF